MALVHGRAASENAFFVLLAKAKQGCKIPELGSGGRKERKREGGGRGQECVGEGAEIKVVSALKKKKSTICISLFTPPPIFENILSVPHVIFFSCIFNLRHAKNTWQVRGVVALR